MNKLLTKIVGAALGLTMTVGVGVAVASNKNAVPAHADPGDTHALFDVTTASNWETSNSSYSSTSWTSNGCKFAYAANNNKQWAYVRLGGKKIEAVDAYIGTTTATSYVTSELNITVVAIYSASHINSVTLKVWSNNTWTTAVDTVDLSDDYAVGTVTARPSSGDYWDSGVYFQLIVNYTNSTNTNRGTDISKLVATEGTPAPVTSPDFTLDKNAVDLTIGGSSTTITATPNEYVAGDATYSWNRTAGDDCVTLTNANTATVTVAPKGSAVSASCTLTIAVTGCTSKTVSVTVKKVSSKDNPFSVSDAIDLVDAGVAADMADVYVHGFISQVDSYNSTYHSITYWISDDGTTTNQFEVYSGKGLDNADFSSISDLEVGYEVVVYGTVKDYNGTKEFDKNNYIVSLVRPNTYGVSTSTSGLTLSTNEVGTTGSVTMTTASKKKGTDVVVGGSATSSVTGNVVTLSEVQSDITINATIVDAVVTGIELSGQTTKFALDSTFSFDGTVTGTYDDWISPHTSETIASGYTVDDSNVDTSTEGSYTVTVSYNGVNANYTVTVAEIFDNTKGEYHKVTDLSQLYDGAHVAIVDADEEYSMLNGFTSTNNVTATSVTKDATTNTISKTSVLDIELVKTSDNEYRFKIDDDLYLYAASSGSNHLKASSLATSGDNGKFLIGLSSGTFSVVAQGSNTRNVMRFNPNNGNPVFSCYASTSTTGTTPAVYVFETYENEAKAYAETFIKGNGSANTCAATISNWSTLGTAYGKLTAGAQKIFREATHNAPETYTTPNEYTVEHAVARYDDALLKHTELRSNEFMGRVDEGTLSYSAPVNSLISNNATNSAAIISIIAVLSLSAVAGYFMLRKRKEQ